jgi:hypothetical protein
MKAIKGSVLFASVSILVSSCFNPPEFSIEPRISLKEIYFGQSVDGGQDSLVLAINFQDRDGDLGFDAANLDHLDYPYHQYNYYLASEGAVTIIPSRRPYSDLDYAFMFPDGATGKLVTLKTLDDPIYAAVLPPYTSGSCVYRYDTVFVEKKDAAIIDTNTVDIIDTLHSPTNPDIIQIDQTFYRTINPNYYNITIEILEQVGADQNDPNSFSPIKLGGECSQEFNARFPVLTSKSESVPLEGVLTYSMKSFGFQAKLNVKPFKVRVIIKDRGLHVSNTAETKVLTLDKIRR